MNNVDRNESRRLQLIELIKASTLSPSSFASRILARDKSTIYRWLGKTSPIPDTMGEWLVGDGPDIVDSFATKQRERV